VVGISNYGAGLAGYSLNSNSGVYGFSSFGYGVLAYGKLGVIGVAGDTSVEFPGDAISAAEVLDEPGIASNTVVTFSISNSGVTSIDSATITVPADGYVVANASAFVYVSGTTQGNIIGSVETSNSAVPSLGGRIVFGSDDEVISATHYRWGEIAPSQTYSVTGPGTYTYYFNMFRGFTGGTAGGYGARIILTYYPSSYGDILTSVPSAAASNFKNARPETVSGPTGEKDQSSRTIYTANLRELELRAIKTRAAAQKAENELLKARIEQGRVNDDGQRDQ
jgi:hypothetical protein